MKIVRFTVDTVVDGRLYFAGQAHEFPGDVADKLISDGVADLPIDSRILSDETKAQIVTEAKEVKPAPKAKRGKK